MTARDRSAPCRLRRLADPAEFEDVYRSCGLGFERLPHLLHPGRAVYVGTVGGASR